MKLILTVLLALGLMAGPVFAQTGTGKSGGIAADAQGLGGGKSTDTQPGVARTGEEGIPAFSEEVATGSDANQAVENLSDPVDPTGDPAGFADMLWTWWKAGWFLPFGFLLSLGIITYAARYVTWLGATPKRALLVAAVTTFFAEVVTRVGTGAPITVPIVMAAIGAAINTWTGGGKAADRAADGKAAKFGPAS